MGSSGELPAFSWPLCSLCLFEVVFFCFFFSSLLCDLENEKQKTPWSLEYIKDYSWIFLMLLSLILNTTLILLSSDSLGYCRVHGVHLIQQSKSSSNGRVAYSRYSNKRVAIDIKFSMSLCESWCFTGEGRVSEAWNTS